MNALFESEHFVVMNPKQYTALWQVFRIGEKVKGGSLNCSECPGRFALTNHQRLELAFGKTILFDSLK